MGIKRDLATDVTDVTDVTDKGSRVRHSNDKTQRNETLKCCDAPLICNEADNHKGSNFKE
jgi:hypothetical protein